MRHTASLAASVPAQHHNKDTRVLVGCSRTRPPSVWPLQRTKGSHAVLRYVLCHLIYACVGGLRCCLSCAATSSESCHCVTGSVRNVSKQFEQLILQFAAAVPPSPMQPVLVITFSYTLQEGLDGFYRSSFVGECTSRACMACETSTCCMPGIPAGLLSHTDMKCTAVVPGTSAMRVVSHSRDQQACLCSTTKAYAGCAAPCF